MIHIILENGFECDIDEASLNDWDLLDYLRQVDKGDISPLPDVCILLLGSEQTNALKNHLRNDKGRVPMDEMVKAITDILNKCNVGKKS